MTDTLSTRRGFLRTLAAGAAGGPFLARAEAAGQALDEELASLAALELAPPPAAALRARYMLRDGLVYLNHASIGTVPRVVHDAHVAHLELCESHPSLYVWGDAWREARRRVRAEAAALLGCDPTDVAVTHNTTEGFNVLAHGLPLGPGDEVLFSSLNHQGASMPWESLARDRGFRVRRFAFPIREGAGLTEADVVAIHEAQFRPATRVLVFPHVDNMIGLRHPLAPLVRAARSAGVEFIVADGAQTAGMMPLELGRSGLDAYSTSPHKWVQSPKGLGLFYVRPELRERLRPMWFRYGVDRYGGSAGMYEDYSTRAWPAVVALGDALDFQVSLGPQAKVERYAALRRRMRERVDAEPGLAWRSPTSWELGASLVAVEVVGRRAVEVGAILDEEHDTNVRAFRPPLNTIRIAPNLANSFEELDRTLDRMARAEAG